MGSASSSQARGEYEDEDDDDDDEDDDNEADHESNSKLLNPNLLEQTPEILPCNAPATPISAASTPRVLGPSIRVWDPCNVLSAPPPPSRFADDAGDSEIQVFLVSHGECGVGLRPDLVGGRWPAAGLTGNGERQARALAVFLNSQGVRFGAVYTSPLDRARATATLVCRELDFAEEQIMFSDALFEMSQGQWECCHRSETYTPEMTGLIDRNRSDFSPPSGESLRQVQFRMVEFLNRTALGLPEKLLAADEAPLHQNEPKGVFSRQSSTNSVPDREFPHWDMPYRQRQGAQRKKSGKSRLQFVTTGDHEAEDELSPRGAHNGHLPHEPGTSRSATSIGIFTHSTPIKCLLAGLLDCSPAMALRICVDDSSVTVLQHSLRTGWQIKRMNDTSHLRLL